MIEKGKINKKINIEENEFVMPVKTIKTLKAKFNKPIKLELPKEESIRVEPLVS